VCLNSSDARRAVLQLDELKEPPAPSAFRLHHR
jgi:hypothetical protein